MVDKVSFKKLRLWIPDLSSCRFTEAKRHCLTHGRGAPVSSAQAPVMRVSTAQIDHFITFITSAHVIQDLPFGERTITLSSKETIKVPNVKRTMVPERLVKQYLAYCEETGFKALSRSTLLRILSVCAASVRKSLQGLDYISSSGAEAFDDLCKVAEMLGDAGQGMGWVKQQETNLRKSKRYLKSDYKVHVSKSSSVPDHCRPFALSDPKDPAYQSVREHDHNDACDRCDLLSETLLQIEAGLAAQTENLSSVEKEDLLGEASQESHLGLEVTPSSLCQPRFCSSGAFGATR
ncbi:unnamed protein product [Pocillopora meandrina]|uniref:Uncharacterized protein n=1 Tax=Pocillopora meandrina TaxID=46732 RepID=A0AAU9W5R6_9CNID|nr:unnamed protein product [Pocillopora meandrina]